MKELTLEQIFEKDGMYKSEGMAKGACFKIIDTTIYLLVYKNEGDFNPVLSPYPVHKSLFEKKYTQVLNRKELFK